MVFKINLFKENFNKFIHIQNVLNFNNTKTILKLYKSGISWRDIMWSDMIIFYVAHIAMMLYDAL